MFPDMSHSSGQDTTYPVHSRLVRVKSSRATTALVVEFVFPANLVPYSVTIVPVFESEAIPIHAAADVRGHDLVDHALVLEQLVEGAGSHRCAQAEPELLVQVVHRLGLLRVRHQDVRHAVARAGQHLLISKDALDKGKRVATRVNALAADHRREEIARMLAGAEITAEARAAAERLLKAAMA